MNIIFWFKLFAFCFFFLLFFILTTYLSKVVSTFLWYYISECWKFIIKPKLNNVAEKIKEKEENEF